MTKKGLLKNVIIENKEVEQKEVSPGTQSEPKKDMYAPSWIRNHEERLSYIDGRSPYI